MDLITQLKRDEGQKLTAYLDSVGILTVGVGHNCISRPVQGVTKVGDSISQQVCDYLLNQDINLSEVGLKTYLPWVAKLDVVRFAALTNMSFNLGIQGLLQFHNALEALRLGNYMLSATNFLDSKWAKQVHDRATRVARQISTGQWV